MKALMLALLLCGICNATAANRGKLVLYCEGEVVSSLVGSNESQKQSEKYHITVDFDKNTIELPTELRLACSAREVSRCSCSIQDSEFSCLSSGHGEDHIWSAIVEINRYSAKMRVRTTHGFKTVIQNTDGWLSCEQYNKAKF